MVNPKHEQPHRYAARRSRSQIERTATLMRAALDLDQSDRVAMLPLLEILLPQIFPDFELRVVDDNMLPGVEGLTDLNRPIITMPSTTYSALYAGDPRARFTAAHELGHFILHNNQPLHYAKVTKPDEQLDPEWQADCFAAAFLMPEAAFRKCSTVEAAQAKFDVGYRAAMKRARTLKHRFKATKKKGTNVNRQSP